jgi:predicted ATPase
LLERAREGVSACMVVSGEAGIGKSRLLDEFANSTQDVLVLRAACHSTETELPFAALSDLLRPVLDCLPKLPQEHRDALRAALALGPPVEGARFAVPLALLDLMSAQAADRGLAVLVDDAQWLDDASADALLVVARRLHAESVLLLLALRDGEGVADRFEDLPRLHLRGLSPTAGAALLRGASSTPPAAAVLQRLASATAGNPLALEHLGRTLTSAQLAGREPLPEPLPVGRRLQEAFAGQAAGLPEPTRLALLLMATATPAPAGPGESCRVRRHRVGGGAGPARSFPPSACPSGADAGRDTQRSAQG